MPLATITLTFSGHMNISAQVGDVVYYSHNTQQNYLNSGFDHSTLSNTIRLGTIVGGSDYDTPITGNLITVEYDSDTIGAPPPNAFISFVKEKKINTSSLLGYYADVKFVNDSKKKAELFSVGSELTESSK
tara:strand:- start:626 stop:1018 length:393 start_codon:yes stop_codon:yes gene_type:complete